MEASLLRPGNRFKKLVLSHDVGLLWAVASGLRGAAAPRWAQRVRASNRVEIDCCESYFLDFWIHPTNTAAVVSEYSSFLLCVLVDKVVRTERCHRYCN